MKFIIKFISALPSPLVAKVLWVMISPGSDIGSVRSDRRGFRTSVAGSDWTKTHDCDKLMFGIYTEVWVSRVYYGSFEVLCAELGLVFFGFPA